MDGDRMALAHNQQKYLSVAENNCPSDRGTCYQRWNSWSRSLCGRKKNRLSGWKWECAVSRCVTAWPTLVALSEGRLRRPKPSTAVKSARGHSSVLCAGKADSMGRASDNHNGEEPDIEISPRW